MTGCRWAIRIGWPNGSIFHYVSMYVGTDEAQAWTLRIHLILACWESGVATCPPHVHHGGALIEAVSDLEILGPQATWVMCNCVSARAAPSRQLRVVADGPSLRSHGGRSD